MPSMAHPPGGTTPADDVKTSAPSSKAGEQTQVIEEVAAKTSKEAAPVSHEPDVDESMLDALEEQKKVPYGRFKEKVEEAKTLKQRLAEMEKQTQAALRRADEDAELRVKARLEREREESQDQELDPVERTLRRNSSEVQSLRDEISQFRSQADHERTQARIERLEQKYPEADSLAVLGWAKAQGMKANSDGIEDLMEKSHNLNIERAQKAVQKIIEHKKAKARSAVPTREGGIRLKDGERPKSLKDAAALTKRYFQGGGD